MRHIYAFIALASASMAHASILPPNSLHLEDDLDTWANITEAEFKQIVTDITNRYQSVFKSHGVKLISNLNWSDSTVNASAVQDSATNWRINMYGGLARRPEVTPDGFALVVCHELGHHLAGFPFYGATHWAASEGQADYFATHTCTKEIWGEEKSVNQRFRNSASDSMFKKCTETWSQTDDQNLCMRTLQAGQSLATLLAAVGQQPTPNIDTPDPKTVENTSVTHPMGQCRLDTYVQGALCRLNFDKFLIPGKKFPQRTSLQAEAEALEQSCATAGSETSGMRPRCWFGPKLESVGVRAIQISPFKIARPSDLNTLSLTIKNRSNSPSNASSIDVTTSSSGVRISNRNIAVPSLAAGQSTNATVGASHTTELGCGEDVIFSVQNSSASSAQNFLMTVGSRSSMAVGEVNVQKPIPDNSNTGVSSSMDSTALSPAYSAQLALVVNHPIVSDLYYTLRAPSGKNYTGRFPSAPSTQKLFEIAVPIKEAQSKGAWHLNIADKSQGDSGEMVSWKLSLVTGFCN